MPTTRFALSQSPRDSSSIPNAPHDIFDPSEDFSHGIDESCTALCLSATCSESVDPSPPIDTRDLLTPNELSKSTSDNVLQGSSTHLGRLQESKHPPPVRSIRAPLPGAAQHPAEGLRTLQTAQLCNQPQGSASNRSETFRGSEEKEAAAAYELARAVLLKQDLVGSPEAVANTFLSVQHVELISRGLQTTLAAEYFLNATHLYLQKNALQEIEGLELLSRLQVLVLHHNQIQTISSLAALKSLMYLDVSYNLIRVLDPASDLPWSSLVYLNLIGNPCCPPLLHAPEALGSSSHIACPTNSPPESSPEVVRMYREGICRVCPELKVLDNTPCYPGAANATGSLEKAARGKRSTEATGQGLPHRLLPPQSEDDACSLTGPCKSADLTQAGLGSSHANPRTSLACVGVAQNGRTTASSDEMLAFPFSFDSTSPRLRCETKLRLVTQTQACRAKQWRLFCPPSKSSLPRADAVDPGNRAEEKEASRPGDPSRTPFQSNDRPEERPAQAPCLEDSANTPACVTSLGDGDTDSTASFTVEVDSSKHDDERLLSHFTLLAPMRRELFSSHKHVSGRDHCMRQSLASPKDAPPDVDKTNELDLFLFFEAEGEAHAEVGTDLLRRRHRRLYRDMNYSSQVNYNRLARALKEQWSSVGKVVQTRQAIVKERQRRLRALPQQRSVAYQRSLEMLQNETHCDDLSRYR